MSMMFEVMCNLLVMIGACGDVMWREEVMIEKFDRKNGS
jgi:hypothetical protein